MHHGAKQNSSDEENQKCDYVVEVIDGSQDLKSERDLNQNSKVLFKKVKVLIEDYNE